MKNVNVLDNATLAGKYLYPDYFDGGFAESALWNYVHLFQEGSYTKPGNGFWNTDHYWSFCTLTNPCLVLRYKVPLLSKAISVTIEVGMFELS